MNLLDIKEHISLIAPATYELNIKLNSEIMKAWFDMNKRIDFYDAFTEALSSNVYAFKKEHYPNENISFYRDTGNLFAYSEPVQKKYLDILQSLNQKTDNIIEQARQSHCYTDKDKMKDFVKNFVSDHFSNYELEKANSPTAIPRFRLFNLSEDIMQDMYHIGVKINEKEIIEQSSLRLLIKFDEFFHKILSKKLYEYRESCFPDERLSFSEKSGALFTHNHKVHSTFLELLTSLNKQSHEILNNLKEMNSIYDDTMQSYLEKYISHHFLQKELSIQANEAIGKTKKKLKV